MDVWKTILFSGLVLLITACAQNDYSAKRDGLSFNINSFESAPNVYVNLSRDDEGKYSIEGYSTVKGDIRLNDLRPMFSTSDLKCTANIGWLGNPDRKTFKCGDSRKLFRKSTQNLESLKINAVLTPMSALVGTLSAGAHAPMKYISTFDAEEYEEFVKLRLLPVRDEVLKTVTNYHENLNNQYSVRVDKSLKIMESLELVPVIVDRTNNFTKSDYVVFLEQNFTGLDSLKIYWKDAEDLKDLIAVNLKNLDETFEVTIRCKINMNFDVIKEGCEKSYVLSDGLKIPSPSLTVLSLKKAKLKLNFEAFSEDITLETFNDEGVRLSNTSNSFLTVDSLSLYVGKNVFSLNNLNLEIPPQSHTSKPVYFAEFDGFNRRTSLSNANAEHLETTLLYGVAVKYSQGEGNTKTLYNKKSEQIKKLL